jgi:tripartite-type tricarboxylate transporter receptor subunit TctC
MERRRAIAALLALSIAARSTRGQQGWPNRAMRLIVPSAAGGILDVFSRRFAQHLSERLRQPIVIDNRPGASNTIGTALAAKSPADGYTFLAGTSSALAIAPTLQQLDYDPLGSFEPIGQLAQPPFVLVCNPSLVARSVSELIALAKAKPRQLTYATTGNAGTNHVAMAAFAQLAGIELVHIPYKGNAPALIDLLANQVQMSFDFPSTAAPHVRSGKLRALMVTGRQRVPLLSEVPTASEASFPGFEMSAWAGLLAPHGTPRTIVDRLHRELQEIFRSPDIHGQLEQEGSMPGTDSPESFRAFIAAEQVRFAAIIKKAHIHRSE